MNLDAIKKSISSHEYNYVKSISTQFNRTFWFEIYATTPFKSDDEIDKMFPVID